MSRQNAGIGFGASLRGPLPDLDLSAFAPDIDRASGQTHYGPTERERIEAAPSRYSKPTAAQARRAAIDEPSRAMERRQAEREAERSKPVVAKPGRKVESASRDHLHAGHSISSRKESTRVTCKERPRATKGKGTSRAFVPWCGRRS